jgi:ribosome assembly protein 1
MRRETSGTTSAQVMLSHWERLVDDPFFVPTTEDEKEEFGEGADAVAHNLARRMVDKVRRRKGLYVQERVVAAATKQRTIARKK